MSSIPGQREGRTVGEPRDVLASYANVQYGRGVIDASKAYDGASDYPYELRPGTPMARITASGLWVPAKRAITTSNGAVTALVVGDARAFKVGDVISVGADTTITVTAIDYGTNTLTIASTTVATGEAVLVADGSGICRGILNEHINLLDDDGVARNKTFGQMVIHGLVFHDKILGELEAIRASGNFVDGISWTDRLGQ